MKKILCFMMLMMLTVVGYSSAETISYIKNIDFSTNGGATVVNINLTEPATFKEGKLTFNNKIYFDFNNTITREKLEIKVNENCIQSVRAAQNMTKPSYISRVVFDMDELVEYTTSISSDGKTVKVTFGTQQKETTAVVEQPKVEETTSRGNIDRVATEEKKLIVIDAGHGGKDPGAIFSSVNEKTLNLDIAKRLRKLLKAQGYEVVMTRTTDEFIELTERANIANTKEADLFISIHNNSMPTGFSGVMTLYSTRDADQDFTSKEFAEVVQENMVKTLGTKNIGARQRDNLVVLNKTTMPAVLVEVGCMSDASELKKLKRATFRQKAAQAICDAVVSLEI